MNPVELLVGADGTRIRWAADPSHWRTALCDTDIRELDATERSRYLDGVTTGPMCP